MGLRERIEGEILRGKRAYNNEYAFGSVLWRDAVLFFFAFMAIFAIPIYQYGYLQPNEGLGLVQRLESDGVDVWATLTLARHEKFFDVEKEFVIQETCDGDGQCIDDFMSKYQSGYVYTCQWKSSSDIQATLTFGNVYARRNQAMHYVLASLLMLDIILYGILFGASRLAFTTTLHWFENYGYAESVY